jgi:hypothetical protein
VIDCAFHGVLTRDAEPKVSANGKSYVRLVVRIGAGDACHFASVAAFNDLDELRGLGKDSRVYVEGDLTLGVWTDRSGKPQPSLSVMAWRVIAQRIGRNRGKQAPRKNAQQMELGGIA